MHQMYLNNPDRFVPVEYHPTWGDQLDPYANAYSDARAAYYGIWVTPTAVFDGSVTSLPHTQWPGLLNQRKNVPSPLDLKVKVTNTGNNFTVKATIKRSGSMASSGLRFHCAVTESKLRYQNRSFHHVLRRMYPGANGTSFTINNGQTKTITVNGTLNAGWVKNNVDFLVWVQHHGSKTVHQARIVTWPEVGVEPSSVGRIKALFE